MKLFKYDLQFFAEDGSTADTASENVDTVNDTADEDGSSQQANDGAEDGAESTEDESKGDEQPAKPVQSREENAVYASMRRRAEATARAQYQRQESALNDRIAARFAGMKNPETGAPITNATEYFDALDAQDRMQAKQQMQEAGIDTSVVDRMIANSPVMRQAQAAMSELNMIHNQQRFDQDVAAIMQIDPTVGSIEDILSQDNFQDLIGLVERSNMSLADAYKIANFERLTSATREASQQAAINQAKSKGHLATAAGIAAKDSLEDIPAQDLSRWQAMHPDKSPKELKVLYNQLKKMRGK